MVCLYNNIIATSLYIVTMYCHQISCACMTIPCILSVTFGENSDPGGFSDKATQSTTVSLYSECASIVSVCTAMPSVSVITVVSIFGNVTVLPTDVPFILQPIKSALVCLQTNSAVPLNVTFRGRGSSINTVWCIHDL